MLEISRDAQQRGLIPEILQSKNVPICLRYERPTIGRAAAVRGQVNMMDESQ